MAEPTPTAVETSTPVMAAAAGSPPATAAPPAQPPKGKSKARPSKKKRKREKKQAEEEPQAVREVAETRKQDLAAGGACTLVRCPVCPKDRFMVWWELELHIIRAHSEWQDRLDPWRRSYNDVEWYESEAGGGADNGNNSTLTYARAAPRSSTVFDSTLGFPGEGPAQPFHEGALNASQGSAETDSPGHRRQDWVVRRRMRRRMRRRRARQQRGGIRACFLDLCRMGIDLSARKGGEVPTGLHTAAAAVCARLIHQATLMVTVARRKQITGPRRRVRRRRARKLAGIRARACDLHAGARHLRDST